MMWPAQEAFLSVGRAPGEGGGGVLNKCLYGLAPPRLLARILKVGVQILGGPKAHIAWRLPEKLKPLRRDFRNSDSCKSLSIYLLNRCFSLKALLSYPFVNLPCLTLNYIWDRNSSCYEEWLKFEVVKPWFTRKNRYAWLCWSNCILVYKCQSPNLRNATSFIIFSKEL